MKRWTVGLTVVLLLVGGGRLDGAVLYRVTDLGTLGGDDIQALAVNDSGQVVGWSRNSSHKRRAFISDGSGTPGSMIDLNTLIDSSSGRILREAYDINNAGQITGHGSYYSQNRAFLLTVIPEPSTSIIWSLLGALAITVGGWRRRRKPA